VTSRDVTDARRMRELLDQQAEIDTLTGLVNLPALRREVSRALAGSESETVGIIAVDLNGFRMVNDARGYVVGDEVLTLVGAGLLKCVRPWDIVARVGGDEFAILVVGNQLERSTSLIFERIQRFLGTLVLSDGTVLPLSASAGYAINDRGDEGTEILLRNADLALSRARTSSQLELMRFEHHMHDALLMRVRAERELRDAFDNNEFVMYFQPIVKLPSRRIVGAEALLRWRHPQRGVLSAYEFIEQIDDLGLGGELRALAVDRAVAALAAINAQHPYIDDFNLSFNISADQLTEQLLTDVATAIDRHGAHPSHLTVEVTESSIASVQEATAVLNRLHGTGLKIAIDDFGVGYSSLGYLAHFPVDYIKIDRSFVQGIDIKEQLEKLTEAIVVLGEALNMPPVVEGVETDAELGILMNVGARYAQGWLFAKAMPLAELLAALDRQVDSPTEPSSHELLDVTGP
jgi:diguanylate cyclase (GGDEF)-like protein